MRNFLKDLRFQPPLWTPKPTLKYTHRLSIKFIMLEKPIYVYLSSEPKAKFLEKTLDLIIKNKPEVEYTKIPHSTDEGWML
jgi:hypothetical protein